MLTSHHVNAVVVHGDVYQSGLVQRKGDEKVFLLHGGEVDLVTALTTFSFESCDISGSLQEVWFEWSSEHSNVNGFDLTVV